MLIGYQTAGFQNMAFVGLLAGGAIGVLIIFLETGLRQISLRGLSSAVFGLLRAFDVQGGI